MPQERGVSAAWLPDELDPDADQRREVYAWYGGAMYYAQVLEHGLVNLVVAVEIGRAIKTELERHALYEELFAKPMGEHVKRVLKEVRLTDAQVLRLGKARAARNFLAHHYFRERAGEFLTVAGRNKLIRELDELCAEFEAVDEELEAITLPLLAKWGVTEDRIEAEANRLRAEFGDESSSPERS
jgi:uncharacterized protein with HEPN domain